MTDQAGPELLPQPWPGTRARALSAQCWEALATEDGADPGRRRLFRLYEGVQAGRGTGRGLTPATAARPGHPGVADALSHMLPKGVPRPRWRRGHRVRGV
ncbi:hypothetical protein ACFVGY_01625 [Streptomyces sp. NPDC127106]|uniref:hypothetical protein n=1 Tax=Streptomyces sp. NPDC127106 TaxID=3345360 RepID=UPI00362FDCA6